MIAKQPAIVSPALRNSANGESCTVRLAGCEGSHGVVLAHIRTAGTGMGRKPDDATAAVYACMNCHDLIDGRRVWTFQVNKAEAILHAMIRTHRRMFDRGLLEVKR